jgi:hypothetical protein
MELTNKVSEFEPHQVVPQPVLEGPLAALLEWHAVAEGAYSVGGAGRSQSQASRIVADLEAGLGQPQCLVAHGQPSFLP